MESRFLRWISLLLAAVAVAAGASFAGWHSVPAKTSVPPVPAAISDDHGASEQPLGIQIYSHGDQSREYFDDTYRRAEGFTREPASARSAIVAHHLLVADKIADLFLRIGADDGRTIVLLSPNHFDVGIRPALVSDGDWTTPYGLLHTDYPAVRRLLASAPFLKKEETPFGHEHGIGALTPFIARSFPSSRIVPIVLSETLSAEDRRALAQAIVEALPDATVLVSVDMSHYLPSTAADFHDDLTLRRIATSGCDGCTTGVEIDANAVLDVLLEVNRLRGDQTWHLTHHDNSLRMLQSDAWRENTSHILGYFTEGAPVAKPHAALTFVGDIMLGRGVRDRIEKNGPGHPWSEVGRFLDGTHLVVGNLEGTVGEQSNEHTDAPPYKFAFTPEAVAEAAKHIDAVSLANNHIRDYGADGEKETRSHLLALGLDWFSSFASPAPVLEKTVNGMPITLIGYHAFAPAEKALLAAIASAHDAGRTVIVMPHWGTEYETAPSEEQRALAKRMVAAGADLIIGGHPHVVQAIEDIDGVPVVYSLGNFIFDQPMPFTRNALALGVVIEPERITLSLLPVLANADGQPEPMADSAATTMLAELAERSSGAWKKTIADGTLTLDRAPR